VCGLRRHLSAEPDPQLFLRIDRNKSIKMSGKLADGVARDSQFFSEHPSRGPPCDSVASCCNVVPVSGTSFLCKFLEYVSPLLGSTLEIF